MLPLDGIRVADFTSNLSGPLCSMILADFGAEVIKIEPPAGEASRNWGIARVGEKGDLSAIYVACNRNKRTISIDLKHPAGHDLAHKIVLESDVLLENFKPGVMDRLGLGYAKLAEAKPELIYCSVSAFGQTGPLANQPGFDLLMQAYAGLLSVTGEKGRPAVRIGPSLIDFLTATHAAFGILLALRERERSGRGQQVDTSLYEAAIVFMTHLIADYTASGRQMERWGPHFPFLAPYGIFMAKDREFYIGVSSDEMWSRFCREIGRTDLIADPRYLRNADRAKNQAELYEELMPLFRQRDAAEWVAVATKLSIPTSLIQDLSEVVRQEQALAREAIVPVEGLGEVRTAGIPVKLSRTPGAIRRSAPSIGQDTDEILEQFGYSTAEIARLRADGAVR